MLLFQVRCFQHSCHCLYEPGEAMLKSATFCTLVIHTRKANTASKADERYEDLCLLLTKKQVGIEQSIPP